MEFFLKNYQHTLETLKQILWLIDAFVHLLFAGAVAKDCGYISGNEFENIKSGYNEIGRMLGSIINKPENFITTNN